MTLYLFVSLFTFFNVPYKPVLYSTCFTLLLDTTVTMIAPIKNIDQLFPFTEMWKFAKPLNTIAHC